MFLELLFVSVALAQDVPVPSLSGHVVDLTATLSPAQAIELENKLAAFEAKKGSQLAVLLVPSALPETIEQFSIRVADKWKLGRKSVDDGAILVIAKQDRKLRIEVGYGLEGALPDATAKRIVSEVIVPRFTTGDFFGGIAAGAASMMSVIDGEPLPPPVKHEWNSHSLPIEWLAGGFFAVLMLGAWLRSTLGTLPAALTSGVLVGLLLKLLVTGLLLACLGGMAMFLLTLFLGVPGIVGSRGLRWGGGGFSGSGGFGGGGFSGGGGGFGGGGASGSW
jgi:uncharacterized protein